MRGLVVLAHGSKVEETNNILLKILEEVTEKVKYDLVEGAYLQLMDPSLEDAIKSLYEKGCKDIVVFPFFLFDGNHIREDIPAEIDKIKEKYTDVKIKFLKNIGYDSKLVDIIVERVEEA